MFRRRLLIHLGFLVVLLPGMVSTVAAQTSDDLFAPHVLNDVQLQVNARDLAALREHWLENTYYPADMTWRGQRIRNVAIRSRGTGSRNPVKLGLRIDFNRYVTGRQFLGLDSLVLDNFWQDPSMLRERTAMALFARLGVPAPREAFCRLFINGVYQGVYALVEPIEEPFLQRTLGDSDGYLFEYEWLRNYYGEDLGDELEPYAELFSPETHESQPLSVLYAPIRDLMREANGDNPALWRERVDPYLDLPAFMRQAAVEAFLADPDGLLGNWGMNNFYLYRGADSTRHRFLPWDKDVAFELSDYPILHNADVNVIFRRAFAEPDLRALFLDVLEQCARDAVQDAWLVTEIEAAAALTAHAAHEDRLKPTSNEERDAAVDALVDFARRRPAFVLREVETLRGR
jgi:spore coat protein CotH